jgi:hypothetical protein
LQPKSAAKKGRAGRTTTEPQVVGWIRGEAESNRQEGQGRMGGGGGLRPPAVEHGDREEGGGDRLLVGAALVRLAADACGSGKEEKVKTILKGSVS